MAEIPLVIGRYEIVTRLGQGGMGSLYLAKDPKIGRLIAIKLVRAEFDTPDARLRFAREAESAGRLRHPNIVTIFDVDEYGGLPFIAMEYVEGETLSEIVRRKAPYPVATKLKWMEHLCSGLAYAHRQGIVHRDIKPANLILDGEGSLKILDFGLARHDASKFTQTQAIIGTPNYMSPEQIRAEDVGPRSDIFAVGAVMYEVLANAEAFPGTVHEAMHKILYEPPKPLHRLVPDLDLAIPAIVARAIEKDPSSRYPDLSQMRDDIARARQHIEQHEETGGTPGRAPADSGATLRLPGSEPHTPPSGGRGGSSSGASSTGRASASSHRATLEKRRAAQIELHINHARRHYDASDLENARTEIERALMFDPDHPAALKLMDDIALEEDRQRIEQLVQRARAELQQGRLEAAEQILAEAAALAPQAAEVRQLRETVETTRREIDRTRQIQAIVRRAKTRFSEGSYEGTLRAVGELLAIDPANVVARELQARAQAAIDDREHRAQRDSEAQAAVSEARELFEQGDKDSAIGRLERFRPPHDLVAAFLATLRGEQIGDAPAIPTQVFPSTPPAPAPAAGAVIDAPSRRGRAIGIAAATVVIVAAAAYLSTRRDDPPAPQVSAPAATAPAPQPVAPAPASLPPVQAPASLTAKPEQTQADREAMQAYRSLAAGSTEEASQLIAKIGRRDPRNEHLADLRAQLKKVVDAEKQRERVAAAGPAAVAASPVPPSAQAADPPVSPAPAQPAKADVPTARPEPPLPSPGEVERPAIEAAISEYARALSAGDLAAVARVRRYSPEEARNWQSIFKRLKEYRLIVKITGPPVVTGDRATVPVDEQFAQTDKTGIQVFTNVRKTEYRLEKLGGRWMLLPPG